LTAQAWLRSREEGARNKTVESEAPADVAPSPISRWNLMMFGLAAILAIAGVAAIDLFGILFGGPALIAAFMLFLGERSLLRIILTATLPVAAVYLLALHVLGAPVP
jgi:hypothetical protein